MKGKNLSDKRQYIRSIVEKNSLILLAGKEKEQKNNLLVGILRDESYHGCSGVFHKPFSLKKNDSVKVTIGKLFDLEGNIVWIKDFNDAFVKVGIYLK